MKLIEINVAPVFSIRIGVYAQRWGTLRVYGIHHHNLIAEVLLIKTHCERSCTCIYQFKYSIYAWKRYIQLWYIVILFPWECMYWKKKHWGVPLLELYAWPPSLLAKGDNMLLSSFHGEMRREAYHHIWLTKIICHILATEACCKKFARN